MTVYIEKEAQNLRAELAALRARIAMGVAQEAFWFSGTGAQTAFALPRGWKPKFVYVDGALRRSGTGEDYTVSFDGFIHTVTFAVAPAIVDVAVICVREG